MEATDGIKISLRDEDGVFLELEPEKPDDEETAGGSGEAGGESSEDGGARSEAASRSREERR